MPHVRVLGQRLGRNLVPDPPQLALRRFDFDYVRAEVGQDYGGAGTSDETRKIDNFKSRKDVVSRSCIFSFHKCFLSWFSVLGIGRGAFAEKPAFLPFCLLFRRRVRRAKLPVTDLRSGLSPGLCLPLRVSTSLRAARWKKSVSGLFQRASSAPQPGRLR